MAGEFKHKEIGTSLTEAEYDAIDAHQLDSQAIGDLIYASSLTQLSRLGIGSTGQLLKVVGGVPAWGLPADLAIASQAADDIIYFNGTNWVRLAVAASRVVAKLAAGTLVAATPAEMKTLLDWAADITTHAGLLTGIHGLALGARVYNSAVQALTTATWTDLTFDTERYDTDTIHSTVSNTDRLTCVTAGKYLIIAQAGFAGNATGVRVVRINRTLAAGGTVAIGSQMLAAATANNISFVFATIYDLAVNDYVTCNVFQNSGGNLNSLQEANAFPEFMMARVG